MSRINVPLGGKKQLEQSREQFSIPADSPDIAFLRKLSIAGRLRYPQGLGLTPITITPPEGETFFLRGAVYTGGGGAGSHTFQLLNDGNLRERVLVLATDSFRSGIEMDSLVGNGARSITATTDNASARVSVFGWVENTSRIRDVTI